MAVKTGLLGCKTASVFVTERGGGERLADLPFSSLSYSRKVDDYSEATIEIAVADALRTDCCVTLDTLEPWQHEITIYRDEIEAWVGPVIDVTYTSDTVTIQARDMFAWMERRKIEADLFPYEIDLSRIFRLYVTHALGRDNTMGIQVQAFDCRIRGTRETLAATSRRAADELRELARSGCDFTTIGRTIYVSGDLSEFVAPDGFGYFTDEAFLDITITKNGMDTATEWTIYGDAGDNPDDPVRGIAGGVDPIYGLVQSTDDDIEILDFGSAEAAARGRLEYSNPVPKSLAVTFSPDAPVDFNDLWGGIVIPVAVQVGCAEYFGDLRVVEVNVTVDENNDETITGNLVPVGATQIGS